MTILVFLDAGPLGMVTNPKDTPICEEARSWLAELEARGFSAVVPEIADYEVRRELLRAGKVAGLRRLDRLKAVLPYLPITTAVMLRSAELWAEVRRSGQPTADPKALDGDVILAAQAILAGESGIEVMVATTNVGHLERLVAAKNWQDI
jgi:predicted nucleic acid-binding protein